MPGRPRTPTSILKARGAFEHNPDRLAARANEPIPKGELGTPPRHLSKDSKKIWKELASIIPAGVAKDCDRMTVEILCDLMVKHRNGTIMVNERTQLLQCLGRLGMNPADRSKVAATPQPEKPREANPWDILSAKTS